MTTRKDFLKTCALAARAGVCCTAGTPEVRASEDGREACDPNDFPRLALFHRIANGCFPVQSGTEFTSRSVLIGIRLIMNFRLKPTLCA